MTQFKSQDPELQQLVELIDFGFDLQAALKVAKENDGVVDFKDWNLLFPLIGEAGVAYQGIERILNGWKNASQEDRDAVRAHFAERFQLPNDAKLEAKIEKAVLILTLLLEILLNQN